MSRLPTPLLVPLGAALVASLGCASPLFGPSGWFDWDGDGSASEVDCNDEDPKIHPGAGERCDGGAVDEDCDGRLDDDDDDVLNPSTWHRDQDGDGYGDPDNTEDACAAPEGFVENGDDCDDEVERIHPGTDEVCDDDDTDEDCDGLADDADPGVLERETWFLDDDGDGFGAIGSETAFCDPPPEAVDNDDDCDDTDDDVNPDAQEVCDRADVDEDCDGGADDADPAGSVDGRTWMYTDQDGDGYGLTGGHLACDPAANETDEPGDCDDANSAIHPDAPEVCGDGIDQDCDASAAGCVLAGDVEDTEADARVQGSAATKLLGWSAATGDTDDDGLAEVWLGAPQATDGVHAGAGGAVRIQGRLAGLHSPEELGLVYISANAVEQDFGYAVAAGDDLTGDGVGDLVLTSPFDATRATEAGAAWIFAGPISSGLTEADAVTVRTGDETSDLLGVSVVTGDWDGDGHADLFTPQYGDGDIYGELGPIPAGSNRTGAVVDVWVTATTGDLLAGGDLDGDGQIELVIGDAGNDKVTIYAGGDRGSLTSSDRTMIFTSAETAETGAALLVGPDLTGDGYGDLVVGAPAYTSSTGQALLFEGPVSGTLDDGDVDLTLTGGWANSEFGKELAAGGDTNGNDREELYVAAPLESSAHDNDGVVYVFDSVPGGGALDTDVAIATVVGSKTSGKLGWSLAVTDLDGDSTPDVLLGAIYLAGTETGGAAIWYGDETY